MAKNKSPRRKKGSFNTLNSPLIGTLIPGESDLYIVKLNKPKALGSLVTFFTTHINYSEEHIEFKRASRELKELESQLPTDSKIILSKEMEDIKKDVDKRKSELNTLFTAALKSNTEAKITSILKGRVLSYEFESSKKTNRKIKSRLSTNRRKKGKYLTVVQVTK